ncbi:peptidase family M28 [Oxobacter pfennigii]|uniref:Peptidase family M28 n=1 Tax=Oxobacter pfennigii TaxID=36849 RepID=A0A0P8WVP7_9CLOT|nr:M28 family peptidase [Oxobacter pfennigii]KPU42335.1 peptidase family M28 [Oxobacter pfennigii]
MLTSEEKALLNQVNFEETVLLLNKFKDLNRQSGSEDEKRASYYISERLNNYGIKNQILWPEIYLSTPRNAELKIIGCNINIHAKTPSYSMSTDGKWIDGELIYASSYRPPYAWGEFEYKLKFQGDPVGKIVICEGIPSPDKIRDIIGNGGIAAIFIQPGENIHEGICTTTWGTPELDDYENMTRIPAVSINNPDGKLLISKLEEKKIRAAVRTSLEEGWKKCPLVLAKIDGYKEPEKFVLLHSHLDSWYKGIGDNALGNASTLEIARILNNSRDKLKRSVWIAWWPGHSTGRYAGSTWFADNYAMELYDNCIAHLNCESTGCINADSYEDIMWTEDVDDFCKELVLEVTGIKSEWARPIRAGDYSFNNIGITSYFMASSTISKKKREELGYYKVYGSGGNLEWHTELDDLKLVDENNFIRDTRLYLAGVYRMVNADILPIDCLKMLDSIQKHANEYQLSCGEEFDLSPLFEEIQILKALMKDFYSKIKKCPDDDEIKAVICDTILRVERKLIRISYTKREEFKHDPAAMVPPLPEIAPVLKIQKLSQNKRKFLITQLLRSRNRVIHTLKECQLFIKKTVF